MKLRLNGTVSLIEGMHFQGRNEDGNIIDMDSMSARAPHAGLAPMELVLHAMAGCTGMDVVFILRKRRLEPERFEIEVEGIEREEHPRMFKKISIVYRAGGSGITLRELERAVGLSQKTYCSVSAMLAKTAEINWRCELID